jgi:hypothetical protein
MWFAYVDESYNESRHWVVALLINHEKINEVSRALREIVEGASDDHGISDVAELHGYDVFHGEGSWEGMHAQVRARISVYRAVLEALVAADCWVILRGVSKPGLLMKYAHPFHPHRVTMTHLIERIDGFCKGARGNDDYAVIVADEHHETQSELLRDLVVYQEHGTWGYLAKKIDRVVDTIHFVNSQTNPLVQGADMIVFLARRWKTHAETDPRSAKAVAELIEIIEPRVHHDHCWFPG